MILIVEDDVRIAHLLKLTLKTREYEVIHASNGITALSFFLANKPELVLLDMGLPDIDGMEVLKQIRQVDNTPVIIVSAREGEKEKVEALDLGADDYVTKPFNSEELLARIRVCLRKSNNGSNKSQTLTIQGLFIDYDKHIVKVDDEEVHLTPIEYKLLTLMAKNPGKVLTHNYIQRTIWGYDSLDEYQSLRVFITGLRKKIENTNHKYIKTEIGIGYRFIE